MPPALWDKPASFSFHTLWVPPETVTAYFPQERVQSTYLQPVLPTLQPCNPPIQGPRLLSQVLGVRTTDGLAISSSKMQHKVLKSPKGKFSTRSPEEKKVLWRLWLSAWYIWCSAVPRLCRIRYNLPGIYVLESEKKMKPNKLPGKAEEERCNSPILGLGETIKGLRTKPSCSVCWKLSLLWPPY